MSIIQFDFNNNTLVILIASIIWALNFRSTFKFIDIHMDSGSYPSLKFDPNLILMKNILSCFFIFGFIYERIISKLSEIKEKKIVRNTLGSMVVFEIKESKTKKDRIFGSMLILNQLNNTKKKIFFWLTNFLIMVFVYFIEEMYFIIANNHILDRLICPMRNLGVLITLLIFSLIKSKGSLYRHQFIPLIIILILSISIIAFNIIGIDRFKKIFRLSFLLYLLSFVLMGLEMVLVKYLLDSQFINIFIILTIKGFIGTIIFIVINKIYTKIQFFNFFDKILCFEYEDMLEEYENGQKSFYVISTVMLQYVKYFIIKRFTEYHLLSVVMITDIIFFPLYCIERFLVEKFSISTKSTFYINAWLGLINSILMLIFNEILECKFWGLDTNLKKNINKRQEEELKRALNPIFSEDESLVVF